MRLPSDIEVCTLLTVAVWTWFTPIKVAALFAALIALLAVVLRVGGLLQHVAGVFAYARSNPGEPAREPCLDGCGRTITVHTMRGRAGFRCGRCGSPVRFTEVIQNA